MKEEKTEEQLALSHAEEKLRKLRAGIRDTMTRGGTMSDWVYYQLERLLEETA